MMLLVVPCLPKQNITVYRQLLLTTSFG
uniref:Uncharacterized protein n=1 Tax=Arundo donax TaxID=35708 RepID=A0A0A9BJK6_ARUDO